MSISEADECSHDEAAKLILENSNSDEKRTKSKKSKERKSVRISDDDITFYPSEDSGYTTSKGECTNLLDGWSDKQETNIIVEEWTEEVFGNDSILSKVKCLR